MPLRSGVRLGPYEILAPIGSGGMGEVYRALDIRLGREVAVKVLPSGLASDPERLRRFEQEARALAALNHPNILGIHDFGREGEVTYAVMELLEGESLLLRLARGPLPVPEARDMAAQVARGLAAAHEKGIVHRDLKPDNVFVTRDGFVKILDFGLARLQRPSAPSGTPPSDALTLEMSTRAGTILGTVGYMAPEQVRGRAADPRSDLFAFGALLYEMLSGRRAFAGESAADILAAILKEDPTPLPTEIPQEMGRIVDRCLDKLPENRYASAQDLLADLLGLPSDLAARPPIRRRFRWPTGKLRWALAAAAVIAVLGVALLLIWRADPRRAPAGAGHRRANSGMTRIVVLPFENLGGQEDSYFAAGMTEEITSRLANLSGLGVVSRTTAVQYDRRRKTIREIGEELGVDFVLEGSVRWDRREGRESLVRITPQLIRVRDDTTVWADRYDRAGTDIFALQAEVAENVVRAMGLALVPSEKAALRQISTSDLEAYDLYLRGLELIQRNQSRQDLEAAIGNFQGAVDRDPRFAQAFAGLAQSHLLVHWYQYDFLPDHVAKAREAAEKAVALRPDLSETHTALGFYYYHGLLDYGRALDEFSLALKLHPNSAGTLFAMATVIRRQGRWEEAAEHMRRALDLDRRNSLWLYNAGETAVLLRRYGEAERDYTLVTALTPQNGGGHARLAWLFVTWRGELAKAKALMVGAAAIPGLQDDPGMLSFQSIQVALFERDYTRALSLLQSEPREAFIFQSGYFPIALLRAQTYDFAGQRNRALREWEAARKDIEARIAKEPGDSRLHGSLCLALAGLGRHEEALREARLGMELMPVSKDAWMGLYRIEDLATVHAMAGRSGEAVEQLDFLLARSGEFSVPQLRLDPRWDPLRRDPGFQALLEKYAVKP